MGSKAREPWDGPSLLPAEPGLIVEGSQMWQC
jgi:hypothetical protein